VELKLDPGTYDDYLAALMLEMMQTIHVKLVEAGLSGQQLEQAAAEIAFSISSIIDDNAAIEANGNEIKPYLMFQTGDDEVMHCGENSYLHEKVYEALKQQYAK
jgi:hypothetical protein